MMKLHKVILTVSQTFYTVKKKRNKSKRKTKAAKRANA
jgi:hypothetical protein